MFMNADTKARFQALYLNKKNLVFRAAVYYTKDRAAAEDFMQAAFLKLFIHMEDMKDEQHAEYWLLRTVKNLAINHQKKYWREEFAEDIIRISDLHKYSISIEEEMLTNQYNEIFIEFREKIFRDLLDVNENWYQAITMLYCMEKPYDEVAAELNVNTDALYSMVYRAKKWIKRTHGAKYLELKRH